MYPFPGLMSPIPSPGQPLVRAVTYHDHYATGGKGTTVGGKFATTADAAEWLVTLVNSAAAGVPTIQDRVSTLLTDAGGGGTVGGVIKSTVTNAANDSVTAQVNGEAFAVLPDQPIVAECRFATSAIASNAFLWGLSATGTVQLTDTTMATTVDNFIGFKVVANTGAILAVVKGAGTETTYATGENFVNLTWKRLRFDVLPQPGGAYIVKFYVDGECVATHKSATAALPQSSVGLTPTFAGKAITTTAFDMYFDYQTFIQQAA
jgi:hypothetical protein